MREDPENSSLESEIWTSANAMLTAEIRATSILAVFAGEVRGAVSRSAAWMLYYLAWNPPYR